MWGKRDDMVVHHADPFNAEPPPAVLAGRPLTPVEAFYSRNHGPIPALDPATWRLRVDGLVDRKLELSLADLQRFPTSTEVATLQCAGNRRAELQAVREIPGQEPWRQATISTAAWTGVRLADVLAEAGPAEGAAHVEFTAPDVSDHAEPPQPYGSSVPLGKARSGEVLLAWAMNDRPLPRVHGGPVRVVVPGYIGARSVKWVRRITVLAEPSQNWFQAVAYRLPPADGEQGAGAQLGPLALTCAILTPDDGAAVAAGPVRVRGYAVAGEHRSVARVEVSGDGGHTWVRADVDGAASRWSWQLWGATLDLGAGPADIVARAWDDTGATQPESVVSVWNPGGYANTAWPRLRVDVR